MNAYRIHVENNGGHGTTPLCKGQDHVRAVTPKAAVLRVLKGRESGKPYVYTNGHNRPEPEGRIDGRISTGQVVYLQNVETDSIHRFFVGSMGDKPLATRLAG